MNILITGATGFIGQRLTAELLAQTTHRITVLTRKHKTHLPSKVRTILIDSIENISNYAQQLSGIDVIIHLAARVHRMDDTARNTYPAYKAINMDSTLRLANQAAAAGVKRFIYISSIKVNGESTETGHPFKAEDPPHPMDPYAISKYESECALLQLSQSSGMETVIIRPPLVYGPGVKANFMKLMRLVSRGLPLPLGAVENRRSLVSIDNLIDLIRLCIDHPDAANQVFLVSDDHDLSTTELLRCIATGMNRPIRLIPFPTPLLRLAAKLFGRNDIANRLFGNLEVDISKTKTLLGWQPVKTPEEAIRQTAQSYLHQIK